MNTFGLENILMASSTSANFLSSSCFLFRIVSVSVLIGKQAICLTSSAWAVKKEGEKKKNKNKQLKKDSLRSVRTTDLLNCCGNSSS